MIKAKETLYLFGPTSDFDSDGKLCVVAKEKLFLMRYLSQAGYKIGLINTDNSKIKISNRKKQCACNKKDYKPFIDLAKKSIPSLIFLPFPTLENKLFEWPRDLFTCIQNVCYVNPKVGNDFSSVAAQLKKILPKRYKLVFSPLGEGGKSIVFGNMIVINENVTDSVRNLLNRHHLEIITFPSDTRTDNFDHLDLIISGLENNLMKKTLIIDRIYAKIPKVKALLNIVNRMGVKIIKINGSKKLIANRIIQMHDGRVLTPIIDFQNKDIIVKFINENNILEPPIKPQNTAWRTSGSWRCYFSELPLF
jgi:hypothetical protein